MNTLYKTAHTRSAIAKAALLISAVLTLSILAPSQAFAKNCKKVHLQIANQTGKTIKVRDVDYWDSESEKWRSIAVKNTQINPGLIWQDTRTLAHVYNQSVKIKVKYSTREKGKIFKNNNKWVKANPFISSSQMCTDKAAYVMSIN